MANNWAILTGFIELALACLVNVYVLQLQIKQLNTRTSLQPLKWLLIGSVVFLILAALPLMFVYADTLWFNIRGSWIVYMAIIMNATAKLLVGIMLYFIYKFRE